MLNRKIEAAPYGGELQVAVEALAKVLAPIDVVMADVETARENRRLANSEQTVAQENCAAVCRRYGDAIAEARRTGHGETAEVQEARRSLARAETRRAETRKAFGMARERQDEAFLRDTMPQINQAAPVLLEVIRLLNDAVNPLAALYGYTISRNLPQPRLLASAPMMLEATRVLTAAINAATAPTPPAASDDDD